jgi:hypothetical protein
MAQTMQGGNSFDTNAVDKGKDVKETKMLDPGAKEAFATGTNSVTRQTTKHKPFGKLGAKGFC